MTYFIAATADRYELPVFVGELQSDLARYLGVRSSVICNALLKSRSGQVVCKGIRRGLKYYRMNADTGEIVIGKALRKEKAT